MKNCFDDPEAATTGDDPLTVDELAKLFLTLALIIEPPSEPTHSQGEEPCAEQSPARPVARPPGPDAANTSTRSEAVCPQASGAKDTRRHRARRAASSNASSGEEPDLNTSPTLWSSHRTTGLGPTREPSAYGIPSRRK